MSEPTPSPPAAAPAPKSWEARPWAARGIRIAVLLVPIFFGCIAAILASEILPVPHGALLVAIRTIVVIATSSAVVVAVDKVARRFLPLAALMSLSLVFPDHAPSRFKSALKSGSSRRLERLVDDARSNGLAEDPGDAARQVVQLIGAIGDHDRRTRGHSERVRLYADLVGEELKLSKEDRQKLQWGALLHDLGKLMVPGEILNKAGKPDPEEWAILQGHPAAGMEMIQPMAPFLGEWVQAIGGHHEKWDGSGYPHHLTGPHIPRAAAIVAVADSFEVMTAVRSYKKAMSLTAARAELTRCAGTHFSPEVVRAFLKISLGELRVAAGPLAALAHLPLLGNLVRVPAVVSAAGSAASTAVGTAAAVPVATAAMLATSMVTAPTTAPTNNTAAPPAAISVVTTTTARSSQQSGATNGNGSAIVAGTETAPGQTGGGTAGIESGSAPLDGGTTVTTTTGVHQATTTTTVASVAATTTVKPTANTTTTTTKKATTTTAAPATTTTKKATTTTVANVTTTTVSPSALALVVSNASFRLPAQTLDGSSFPAGTTVYVYAISLADSVRFTYPGGTNNDTSAPFDMIGGSLLNATGFILPSTPGDYTFTAVSTKDGEHTTVTATVHVT